MKRYINGYGYVDIKITDDDYKCIIKCKDDYFLTNVKHILSELKINYTISTYRVIISYKDYDFDKIGGINVFIDKCRNIINHKYEIRKIKEELTIIK